MKFIKMLALSLLNMNFIIAESNNKQIFEQFISKLKDDADLFKRKIDNDKELTSIASSYDSLNKNREEEYEKELKYFKRLEEINLLIPAARAPFFYECGDKKNKDDFINCLKDTLKKLQNDDSVKTMKEQFHLAASELEEEAQNTVYIEETEEYKNFEAILKKYGVALELKLKIKNNTNNK